jgi:hypothetical protein
MSKGQNINVDVDSGDTAKFIVYGVVGLAVAGVAYFGVIRPILQTFQIIDTKEEKKGKKGEAKLTRKQVLSSSLYKKNKDKITISSAKAHTNAKEVYNSRGTWKDDEERAVGALTSAGSLVNLSYIAYTFQKLYGADMQSYMNYFEPEHWTAIDQYVSKTKRF